MKSNGKWKKRLAVTGGIIVIVLAAASVYIGRAMKNFNIQKVDDHLYSIHCKDYNYSLARLVTGFIACDAGCSSVRKGDIVGRNFDWDYTDEAEFVLRTDRRKGRYASIGVAAVSGVTDDYVKSGKYTPVYNVLPFFTVDGINEKGLEANVNIAPAGDAGVTSGTNPGAERLCSAYIVRYLLDYAKDTDEAVKLLEEHDIFALEYEGAASEFHIMVSDPEKTVVIEFIDNKMKVLRDEKILTNYYLGLDDYTPNSMGIERYDMLEDEYDSISGGVKGMADAMKSVYYSNTYNPDMDPRWISDRCNESKASDGEVFSLESDVDKFREVFAEEDREFKKKKRDGKFYITTHTSIFNLKKKTMSVIANEGDRIHSFSVK